MIPRSPRLAPRALPFVRGALLGLGLAVVACTHAGALPTPATPAAAPTPAPTPTPSFARDGSNAVIRFQLARVREAPFSAQLSAFIARSGTWTVLSAGSSADPVTDVDGMVCTSRPVSISSAGVVADRWIFVMRHAHSDDEVRHRIDRMSQSSGRTVVWSSTLGFASAPLPVPRSGFAQHAIVLTAPHEVVVGPVEDVERIARVAAIQHGPGSSGVVEPGLAPETEREIAMIDLRPTLADDATIALPDGSRTPRTVYFHLLAERATAGVDIHATMTFGTEADALRAEEQIRIAVQQLTDSITARALGFTAMARALSCTVDGTSLHYAISLDDRQVSTVLAAMSLAGFGS